MSAPRAGGRGRAANAIMFAFAGAFVGPMFFFSGAAEIPVDGILLIAAIGAVIGAVWGWREG